MMERLASQIATFFAQKNQIAAEQIHIYAYCFEVLLSAVVSWGSILAIAVLTNTLWATVCYIGCFCLFRSVAGGYHASTHLRCYVLSVAAYTLFLFVRLYLPIQQIDIACYLLAMSSVVILVRLAPLEHKNNPFTLQMYRRLRRLLLISLSFFIMVLSVSLLLTCLQTAFAVTWGCAQTAVSVAAASFYKKEEGQYEEGNY